MTRKAGLFFTEKGGEKMPLEQEKVVPMALFTPSEGKIRGVKGRIKGGKTRNFLIYFVKILVKTARKL